MTRHLYPMRPARQGWTQRYRPLIEGAVELVVFGAFLLTVVGVLFFATWMGPR